MSCSVKKWVEVTVDVTESTSPPYEALFVGSGGDVTYIDAEGDTITLPNCATGGVYYFEFTSITSASTASSMLAGRI